MKTIITLFLILIFAFAMMSCEREPGGIDYAVDNHPSWINMDTFYYPDTSVYDISSYLTFYYPVGLDERLEYSVDMRRNFATTGGIFEINGDVKPFSEWNECNIKFPSDTTKNWLFRFVGKNIPTNFSFLYDTKNNIGDTLIFWDTVDNITYHYFKYYSKKRLPFQFK